MRWIANKAFPHPVLSSAEAAKDRDYVCKAFQAPCEFSLTSDGCPALDVRCNLSEESILGLIEGGQAVYAVEVYCPKTFLRRLLTSKPPEFSHVFAQGELHERVEVSAYVVCRSSVKEHRSENFHSEFGDDASFNLASGDVLAITEPAIYWWDTEFLKPISSVFELEGNSIAPADSFLLSWDGEKVKILMRPEVKERFNRARGDRRMKPFLLMSVYLSALTETLRMMTADDSEHGEKKWFQAIEYKLSEKDIRLDGNASLAKIAQQLLDWPLGKMLSVSEEM